MLLGMGRTPNVDYDKRHMPHRDELSILTTELSLNCGTSDFLSDQPDKPAMLYARSCSETSRLPYATGASRTLRQAWHNSRDPMWCTKILSTNPHVVQVTLRSYLCYTQRQMSPQRQRFLRDMHYMVDNYGALIRTEKKDVFIPFYLCAKTDGSNLIANRLHSRPNPIDGYSGLACSCLHHLKGPTDRTASMQPGKLLVTGATEIGVNKNPAWRTKIGETLS